MKLLPYLIAFLLVVTGAGTAHAYQVGGYPDRVMLAQQRVMVREVRTGTVVAQVPQRQRRFVMPPSGVVYQRGGGPQYMPPGYAPKATRMTIEERRALRVQINQANQGIYRNSRTRVVQP